MNIKVSDLCMDFGEKRVLDHVSLDLDLTTLAIIGPSGGGKSTLLRILGGLLAPTSGTVEVDGRQVIYDERTLPAYRAGIGYVFQQGGLFQHLSALENIALPLREVHGLGETEAHDRAMELLERFGLADAANQLPAQLSGGQQQRAAIARAVAPRPKLLLLDEPTSALDPVYTNDVLDLVADLREEGLRFVIVTHEMGFARRACDECAFLYGGRIVERAPSDQLFSNPREPETQHFLSRMLEWR
ncbi:MAG: amino acid ABC transporter ATP-binding protein [Tractidigestivibacter sp.]|uniref:amino acid ABC transporter ATP-binding protein n=1 Tax=Tractidigestivibacter sp. TaxID=2847320 RepID=UPI003D8F2111